MSVLDNPRITFRGQVAWDPIVTNNSDTNYDEAACQNLPVNDPADAYRKSAIDQVVGGGNWNPHGTHRSVFYDTSISAVDLGFGTTVKDPFIGVPVAFSGMLVDLEPYGATTSQLFFDEMSFGIQGGCRIAGKRVFRFTDRYINFARNASNNMIAGIAGTTWQTCFPKDSLAVDVHDSAALQAMTSALADPDVLGLMVRWHAYRTVYFDDPTLRNGSPQVTGKSQELQAKLRAGGWQPNPARSLLVGSIGLWRKDDPIHEPGDRALVPQGVQLSDGTMFGPVFAKLGSSSITLDFGGFIPEVDRDANKHDVGLLRLVAVDPANNSNILATLGQIAPAQYDKAAYETNAGIFSLTVDPGDLALAQQADLQILDATDTILASEVAQRAIAEDPNLYLEEGANLASRVRVYHRGVPVGQGTALQLVNFNDNTTTGQPQTTDDDGFVSFQFLGQAPGIVQYGFAFPPNPIPASLDSTSVTFMSVRVWPSDDAIAALDPTWPNVYTHVLSNWYAMAPCMDNWLLLNDPDMVKRYGPLVKKLTAPDNFESFRFMPVTRDLTAGKRQLLYRYLDGFTDSASLEEGVPRAKAATLDGSAHNAILVKPDKALRAARQPSKNVEL